VDQALLKRLFLDHVAQLERGYGRALAASGYDAVVIHSGSAQLRSAFDDQYWPLRTTPHFQHWLPLTAADCALVIAAGRKPKLLWLREYSFWETLETPREDFWQDSFEIVQFGSKDALREHLPGGRSAFVGEDKAWAARRGWQEPDVLPAPLVSQLDALRTLKTRYEELCLEEANRRAAPGHAALAAAFRDGAASELDLHLLFLRATQQDDPETPYKNIIALGPHAATLHHVTYSKTAPSSTGAQSLLVDAGASCYGYCADITRTHVKGSGALASTFAGLADSVDRLQRALCAEVQLGKPYEALHDRAHEHVAAALREAGIVKLSADEAVHTGTTRVFFPHGLGHSLGLQCHDVGCASIKPRPDNPFLRNTSTIAERQCFTIEPGIYFIGALLDELRRAPHASGIDWKLVAELSSLGGIRVEDDLVVHAGSPSARNLTRQFLPD